MKQVFRYLKQIFSQEFIDRTISGGIKGQITLLSIVIIGVFFIASALVICLNIGLGCEDNWTDQLWVLYNNFVDPGNQNSQQGTGNRLTVIIISLLGSILLGGVLISTISNIIERRVEAVRTGKAYYRSIKNHFIIIGCSNIVVSLIKELHKEDPEAAIVVMSCQESERVRHNLQASLDKDEERHVYIYFGNIESIDELKRLNIDRAKEVYILGEEGDYGRDAKNIQCVHSVSILKGPAEEGKELPVYTQFDRLSSYSVIQKLNTLSNAHDGSTNIYFRPFNIHENWARRLWSIYSYDNDSPYDRLDYDTIRLLPDGDVRNKDRFVHLVIIGFGGMGQALLLEAIRICHYANYDDTQESGSRIRTQITVIDGNIDTLQQHFTAMFPNLGAQVDDIQITYRHDNTCSPSVRESLKQWCCDPRQMLTVAVCISDPDESITIGLNLPREVYQSDARVLIRQEIQTDMGLAIHTDNGRYRNVKIFGMLDQGISKHMLLDEIPSYINQEYEKNGYIKELYRLHILHELSELQKKKATARKSWINLNENMRWANRYQIDAYRTFIHTLGYDIVQSSDNKVSVVSPEKFSEDLTDDKLLVLMRMEKHRWNAERTLEGWRYGDTRDNTHRIHDKLIPFHDTPYEERLKDKQVITNLAYLMPLAGFIIVPD